MHATVPLVAPFVQREPGFRRQSRLDVDDANAGVSDWPIQSP